MKHKHVLRRVPVAVATTVAVATMVAVVAVGVGPAVASSGTVNVRIEGLKKTLRPFRNAQIKGGAFTRQGYAIKYDTALGALELVTAGNWQGTYDTKYSEWELTSILGESHAFSSKYFWAIYVNNVQASSGADQITLKAGDDLVFAAISDADYDEDLIGINTPDVPYKGRSYLVDVVYYNASGKSLPLAGAKVTIGTAVAVTNASGVAKLTPRKTGTQTVTASKTGYVRDETNRKVRA